MRSSPDALLLLAPSEGFGGGIERVARAVDDAWPGRVARLDLYRHGRHDTPRGNTPAKAQLMARAVRAAARNPAGTVLALHVGLLPAAFAAGMLTRARVALLGMGVEVWTPMSLARRSSLSRCDTLLAISTFTADVMAERARIPRARVGVLAPPVAPHFAADAEIPLVARSPEAEPRLLTVSRIVASDRYKGLFEIAESLPRVLEARPRTRWTVVGGGDDANALIARCHELGLGDAVEFAGNVHDARLRDLYRDADMLVLPSTADPDATPPRGEGFGLVFAEAGAYGVPAVASRAGGGSLDFVKDGQTGVTVPPSDPAALAAAILSLIDQPELRARLGAAARALVLERHTPARFADELQALLRS